MNTNKRFLGLPIKPRNPKLKGEKKPHKFKMLSAFTMLIIIIGIFAVVSWILDANGVWAHWADVDGTRHSAQIQAIGIVDVFLSPLKGFMERASILIFILMLGAFINFLLVSKTLDGTAQAITRKLKGKEIWIIPVLMVFFSICGTTEGMAEESIGFYMITVPLLIAAGFDSFSGFLIVLVGAGVGVLASTVNPFVITVALNGISISPTVSSGDGIVWRLVSWVLLTGVGVLFTMWYAMRVKKNQHRSITFDTREEDHKYFLKNIAEPIKMDWRRKTSLAVFAITFIIMIIYLIGWDQIIYSNQATGEFTKAGQWFNDHIPWITSQIPGFGVGGLENVGAMFLVSSIIVGLINWKGEADFIKNLIAGASDILGVCLVIATAAGLNWLLVHSYMQQLIVKGLVSGLGGLSWPALLVILYLIFLPMSFLIPSTSGFATAVFPLLGAPGGLLAQNGSVLGSGSVTAFSFANGLVNLFTPTSGVVMGALGVSRISYDRLWRGAWPLFLIIFVLSIVLLLVGGAIGGKIF